MAIQDHYIPAFWTQAGLTSRDRFRRLLGSDLFALGLGGVLWSALILVVVRSSA